MHQPIEKLHSSHKVLCPLVNECIPRGNTVSSVRSIEYNARCPMNVFYVKIPLAVSVNIPLMLAG